MRFSRGESSQRTRRPFVVTSSSPSWCGENTGRNEDRLLAAKLATQEREDALGPLVGMRGVRHDVLAARDDPELRARVRARCLQVQTVVQGPGRVVWCVVEGGRPVGGRGE